MRSRAALRTGTPFSASTRSPTFNPASAAPEPGLTALALALLGLILPIGLSRLVRLTPLKLLYRRPKVFRLKGVAPGSGGQLIGASYDRAEEA